MKKSYLASDKVNTVFPVPFNALIILKIFRRFNILNALLEV